MRTTQKAAVMCQSTIPTPTNDDKEIEQTDGDNVMWDERVWLAGRSEFAHAEADTE